MKKIYFLFLTVLLSVFTVMHVTAQHWIVNQVIVGSGGDWNNPDDYVSMASYKPGSGVTTTFGNIFTQSIQDIVISDQYVYVAAQDSIAKFNIDTYEKVAAIEAIGINRLLVNNDELIASFQYPVTENFVRIYSTNDLTLLSNIGDVSNESAGLLVVNELAYAAVPGGWTSTVGKIAIISLLDYSLVDEIDFYTIGRGISDLFYYEDKIMSINRTPWGGSSGYISVTNMLGSHTESHFINASIGKFIGLKDTMLYTIMNDGVGSINLNDFSVADAAIVQPPALTLASAIMDTLNNLFYVASTDYFSIGVGAIYNLAGEETGSFDAGISPDAMAIDYRDNTGIDELYSENKMHIYPNPSNGVITVEVVAGIYSDNFKVVDISGRTILDGSISFNSRAANIDISMLEIGLYFFILSNNNEVITSPFVKK